jgi:hypothetical protein
MESSTFFFCGFHLEKKQKSKGQFPQKVQIYSPTIQHSSCSPVWFYYLVHIHKLSLEILKPRFFSLIFCFCYWWMKILFLKYVFYSSHVKGMWKERLYYFLKVSTFFKCCRFVKNKQTGALLEAKKNNAIFLINQQEIWWQIIYLSRIQEVTFCSYSFIEKLIS